MKIAEMKISTRLAIGFSLVLCMLGLVVGLASWRLQGTSDAVRLMLDKAMAKERLAAEWAANTDVNSARIMTVGESTDPARQKQLRERIKKTGNRTSEIQNMLDSFEQDDEEKRLLAEIAAQQKIYIAARDEVFKEKAGSEENARRFVLSSLEPALNGYTASIHKLTAYQTASVTAMVEEITALTDKSQRLLMLLGALVASLGIAVSTLISRSIKSQLDGEPGHAVRIASRIAEGNLTGAIDTASAHGASPMHAMKTMQDAALAEQSAAASKSMEDQARNLAQAVSVFRIGSMPPGVTPVSGTLRPVRNMAARGASALPRAGNCE